jgi:hypothetical protein
MAPRTMTAAAAPTTAEPTAAAAAPNATTITATSRPSSDTPLNDSTNPVQSNPRSPESAESKSGAVWPTPHPSWATRSTPLRNHCRPNTSSNAPTISRTGVSGTLRTAVPSAATSTASTTKPALAPTSDARQERATPTPTTIATISITSIAVAKNAASSTDGFTSPSPYRQKAHRVAHFRAQRH